MTHFQACSKDDGIVFFIHGEWQETSRQRVTAEITLRGAVRSWASVAGFLEIAGKKENEEKENVTIVKITRM